jgi:hypothetical protein
MTSNQRSDIFRDAEQRGITCRVLCEIVSLPGLWSAFGPTDQARELLAKKGSGLSAGQSVYFFVAWDLWDGSQPPFARGYTFRAIAEIASGQYLRILGELLAAISAGFDGIDAWIARYDTGFMPRK